MAKSSSGGTSIYTCDPFRKPSLRAADRDRLDPPRLIARKAPLAVHRRHVRNQQFRGGLTRERGLSLAHDEHLLARPGALQNGDVVRFEVGANGSMTLHVKDALNREWERGVDEEMAARARNATA